MFEMKFDPRELTDAERACVARMLTDWPSYHMEELAPATAPEPTFGSKSETQLLAEEQAADLAEHREHLENSDQAAAHAAFAGEVPDRDADGLPWDRRIHSGSKARNADGTWRKMRGVDPTLVESVTAELRTLMAAPVTSVVQVPPPPPATELVAAVVQVPPPPPAPAVTSAATDAPVTLSDLLTVALSDLLTEVGQAIMRKVITSEELSGVCAKHGVANVGMLVSRKDLVPQVAADFRALVASKGQSQ